MLDYLAVKQFHAKKLAEDAEGGGRVESAFYHTMKMVYLHGVEDGRKVIMHGDTVRAEERIVGIDGGDQ